MNLALIGRVLVRREQLRRHDQWTREQLESHQARALRQLRDHAVANSAFYAELHRGLENRPLHELPVISKREVMERYNDVLTNPDLRFEDIERHAKVMQPGEPLQGRYWVAATSGSTGRRGLFVCNTREWATVLASYSRANDWAGVRAGLTRHLRVGVVSSLTPWHQSNLVGASLHSPIVNTLRLDATQPWSSILSALNVFRPDILVAYADVGALLAEEQLAGRLHIKPEAVFAASEVLTEAARAKIASAFGRQPFNVYAATETAGIASECEQHRGLHLYEDLVVTEFVDDKNQPVPPESYGARVLVTVLFNKTLPLIRYEMSDRVAPSAQRCSCGRPFALIAGIEGRAEDILRMRSADGADVIIHPLVFHRVMDATPSRGWQVVQMGERHIKLIVANERGDTLAMQRELLKALHEAGVAGAEVAVEVVQDIPRTALGKVKLVVRQ